MKTIATELVESGARKDERGRKIVPKEEREALIAEYEKSGLTQKAFAQREGIKFCTFTAWLMRRKRHQVPVFAEVALPGGGSNPVEVILPEGVTVRGSNGELVAAVVTRLLRC